MIKAYYKDLKTILGKKLIIFYYTVFFFTSLSAILDIFSLGSIVVFLGIIIDPDKYLSNFSEISLVSTYLSYDHLNKIIIGSIIVVAIFIFKNIALFFSNYLNVKLGYKIKAHLTKRLFKSYLYRDYKFHLDINPSTLWKNIIIEVENCTIYFSALTKLLGSIIMILGLFFLITYNSSIYTSIIFFVLALFIAVFYLNFQDIIKKRSAIRSNYDAKISKCINEAYGSIKETILFKRQNFFLNIFDNFFEQSEKQRVFTNIIVSIPRLVLEVLSVIILMIIFIVFTYQGKIFFEIIPFLTLLTLSIVRAMPVFNQISRSLQQIRFLKNSKNILLKEINILNTVEENKKNEVYKNQRAHTEKFSSLKLKGLNYSYDPKNKIIADLNLTINRGSKVLFVGPSGAGKTTLLNLVLGLLEPSKGEILCNDKSINFNIEDWQSKIGYIPQDIYLLDDNIKNNVIFSDDSFKEENFNNALSYSKLDKEIKKFQDGLETIIGHRGKKLSGGQKQRLAIARAFYKKPEILVMDEPTTGLDEASEIEIINNLFDDSKDLTIIMVAHKSKSYEKRFDIIHKL